MKSHICIVCGKSFQSKRVDAIYCSNNCYNKYHYENYPEQADKRREYAKQYYYTHREEKKEYVKNYKSKHRAEELKYAKKYRKKHATEIKKKRYNYYTKEKSFPRYKRKRYLSHIKNYYNLSQGDIEHLYEEQEGLCIICRQPLQDDICVDHDHTTNKIRGLLHNRCNGILANYEINQKEKEAYLQNNLSYLNIEYKKVRYQNKKYDYELFIRLLKMQGMQCPICHRPFSWFDVNSYGKILWHIDHIHNTGIVRGILCHKCNADLGRLEKIKEYGQDRIERYILNGNVPLSISPRIQ